MNNIEYTLAAQTGGGSLKLSIATAGTSVRTPAAIGATGVDTVVVTPTAACFFRRCNSTGAATADGTDQYLLPNNAYRIFGLLPGEYLAFNGSTPCDIFLTPGG